MIVNLFENNTILKDCARADRYVHNRTFSLNTTPEDVEKHLASVESDSKQFIKFRDNTLQLLHLKRKYSELGGYYCDNMFNLELLGLDKNSKKYMILVDFSEALDYVLHRLSHCKMENIKSIENYSLLSRCLLNNDMSEIEHLNFSVFMNIDKELDQYLVDLYTEVENSYSDPYRTEDKLLERYITVFYNRLLGEIDGLKAYIMRYLREENDSLRYKSKSFAASVGTLDVVPVDNVLILKDNSYEDYTLNLGVFEKYEYVNSLI